MTVMILQVWEKLMRGQALGKYPPKRVKIACQEKETEKVGLADDILSSSEGSDPPHSGAEDK